MKLNRVAGGFFLASALAFIGCASMNSNKGIALREPSSMRGEVASEEPLEELIKRGIREAASWDDRVKIVKAQDGLAKKEQRLRKALELEGLSEETKQSMIRDIHAVNEQFREVSRIFPMDSMARTRLSSKHFAELVKMYNKACPKNPITFKDDVVSYKGASGSTVQAKVDFEGLSYSYPYITFTVDAFYIPFMFLTDPKYNGQGWDRGGEGGFYISDKDGRLLNAGFEIFEFQSPLPGGMLKKHLPDSWLRFVSHNNYCTPK